MLACYKTVVDQAQAEIIEKKSRFIANVVPVQSQEEAESYLQGFRKQYYDATHNCFAYQIGERNEIQKCSDDGEPQGTAGKPILDVLKGEDIKNTLIVVTRYFGGTLLGTGGLVRAYGKAAKEGVLAAGLVEKRLVQLMQLDVPYTLLGRAQYLLSEKGYVIAESEYTHLVNLTVQVASGDEERFIKWFTDQTNAEITITKGEYCQITVPIA